MNSSHHCFVELLLNGLIYMLVVLLRVMDGEGLSEKQSGIGTNLKVRSLGKPIRKTLDNIEKVPKYNLIQFKYDIQK